MNTALSRLYPMNEIKNLNLDVILDNMTESLVVVDSSGKVVFFNKIASSWNLSGKPLDYGVDLTDIVSPERVPLVKAILKRVRETGHAQSCEAEYRDEQGRPVYFDIVYNPLLSSLGSRRTTEHIAIFFRDITSQKTYEKKIVQLASEITRLIENANAVIFGVDSRGYIMEWNKECRRVSNYERNDVYARKFPDLLLSQEHHATFWSQLQKVLDGEPISNYELSMLVKDGAPVTILLNVTPKINSLGEVIGALFVGQDITELSEYRKSLEQKVIDRTQKLQEALQKEKELVEIKNRFVSIASHEFKVPLSSISASINLLTNSGEKLSEETLARLRNIEGQVAYMKSLLEDVLTVGKAEVSKLRANNQRIDLIQFFMKIAEEVSVSTQRSHMIRMDCSVESLYLETDEKLLRNIFINLLSNAVKFSPGKKEVLLSVHVCGEHIEIKVKDDGIGIEKKDLDKVFEPFNRGSNSQHIKGTGLGLSIVKRAVETLEGSLSLESEVGMGTCFTVRLKK